MSENKPPKQDKPIGNREEFKEGYNPPRYEDERPKPPPKSPPKKVKSK